MNPDEVMAYLESLFLKTITDEELDAVAMSAWFDAMETEKSPPPLDDGDKGPGQD